MLAPGSFGHLPRHSSGTSLLFCIGTFKLPCYLPCPDRPFLWGCLGWFPLVGNGVWKSRPGVPSTAGAHCSRPFRCTGPGFIRTAPIQIPDDGPPPPNISELQPHHSFRIALPVPPPTPSLLGKVQDFFADLFVLKDLGCMVRVLSSQATGMDSFLCGCDHVPRKLNFPKQVAGWYSLRATVWRSLVQNYRPNGAVPGLG